MNSKLLGDILPIFENEVLNGDPPPILDCGPLSLMRLQPRKVVLIGAPPEHAKTPLAMQLTFDALYRQPELKAVVCNVEMPPEDLLERELARASGVPLDYIQDREIKKRELTENIKTGFQMLSQIKNRIAFVSPPFTLRHTHEVAESMGAGLIVLDYIQRIPPDNETYSDLRLQINNAMDRIREMANGFDRTIVVISSVSRKDDYKNVNLASFKETGELEFGANSAYTLTMHPDRAGSMLLKQLKGKDRKKKNIPLTFNGEYQLFELEAGDHWR